MKSIYGDRKPVSDNSIHTMHIERLVAALILGAAIGVATPLTGGVVDRVCSPPGSEKLIKSTCTVCDQALGCLDNDQGSELYSC